MGLSDTMWMRDFVLLQAKVDLMMELHDDTLFAYNQFFDLEKWNLKTRQDVEERRKKYAEIKKLSEEQKVKDERDAQQNRYQPLIELLSASDLALMNALCVTAGAEQDQVLSSVIRVLDAHKKTMPIIKLTITNEVSQTSNAATLFRGNSTATKLMTAFTKMTGQQYLQQITEVIQKVVSDASGFEVDSSKGKNIDVKANMQKLMSTSQSFLDTIVGSVDECPLPFREMASHLQKEVVKRFPNAKFTSVAGFIFLRFFCPAISAPDSNGLVEGTLSSESRRALVLISKSIQNLANGQKFGVKESFMNDMNGFIDNNLDAVQNYLDSLAEIPENTDYEPLCSYEEAMETEIPALHETIVRNLDKIGKTLYNYKQEDIIPHLTQILGDLGELQGVEIIEAPN